MYCHLILKGVSSKATVCACVCVVLFVGEYKIQTAPCQETPTNRRRTKEEKGANCLIGWIGGGDSSFVIIRAKIPFVSKSDYQKKKLLKAIGKCLKSIKLWNVIRPLWSPAIR